MNRKNFLLRALAIGATLTLGTGAAIAQAFPSRPIKMIVPFNAGASVDTIARSMALLMSKKLNQPVVVENRPGANAAIAAQAVASAPADGYTVFFASDSALVLNGLLYKKLAYDAERDFTAVALAANVPLVMLVNSSLPVKNLQEFVAYGKQNPGKLNYSSTGTGGAFHLAGELFDQASGVNMTHVPYTGGAPAIQALLAGQVQVMFGIVGSSLPHVRAGKVLPGVPTLHETGYPGLEAMVRYGLVAHKKTPPEVLAVLNDAANFALADAGYREKYIGEGYLVPQPHRGSEFDAIIAADRLRWGKLIAARGITVD